LSDEFGHEKLRVYQKAIAFVASCEEFWPGLPSSASVRDQLSRASESIPENIADGNGRRSLKGRLRCFDIAYGSGLECAGCLDICGVKGFLADDRIQAGKQMLSAIVRMLIGLRHSKVPVVREDGAEFGTDQSETLFSHETLDVYRVSLEFVGWSHAFAGSHSLGSRQATQLDKTSTSIVLNIAEGNGRFSVLEHQNFLDIAHRAGLRAAGCLDVVVAKGAARPDAILQGKQLLRRIVSMLIAMKGKPEYGSDDDE